jgi:hypothetical protein
MSVSMFIYSICKSRIANANGQHVPFFGHPTIRIYFAVFEEHVDCFALNVECSSYSLHTAM